MIFYFIVFIPLKQTEIAFAASPGVENKICAGPSRTEIPFRLHKIFSDFPQASFAGLKKPG